MTFSILSQFLLTFTTEKQILRAEKIFIYSRKSGEPGKPAGWSSCHSSAISRPWPGASQIKKAYLAELGSQARFKARSKPPYTSSAGSSPPVASIEAINLVTLSKSYVKSYTSNLRASLTSRYPTKATLTFRPFSKSALTFAMILWRVSLLRSIHVCIEAVQSNSKHISRLCVVALLASIGLTGGFLSEGLTTVSSFGLEMVFD